MINILIVDDEVLAAEGVRDMLRRSGLGMDAVFLAHSKFQAEEIFRTEDIGIMLCDIEMPRGSGLELARWVREQGYDAEMVFLTCHEDFNYVKRALGVGALDYLLKPVRLPELEAALIKAVGRLRGRGDLSGEQAKDGGPGLRESFWYQVARGAVAPSRPEILQKAWEAGVALKEDDRMFPILIVLHGYGENWTERDMPLITYAQRNMAEELFSGEGDCGAVCFLDKNRLLALRCPAKRAELPALTERCDKYVEVFHKRMGIDLCCYLGGNIAVEALSSELTRLENMERNNLYRNNRTFVGDGAGRARRRLSLPNMDGWFAMLSQGLGARVMEEIVGFFHNPDVAENVDADYLVGFQQDFFQMVYAVYRQRGIKAHFIADENRKIMEQATRSVPDLLICINRLIKGLTGTPAPDRTAEVIGRVKAYILDNLDREMSREDMARHVFLHPDYLSRLFKRETGMSMIDFMIQERMELAKKLLSENGMLVSDVAARVGYSNFSHFSKTFKQKVGVNPAAYRRLALK